MPTTIQGTVFNDLNGNGAIDVGEPGLSGWMVFLDPDHDGVAGPGEPTATTDSAGHYLFDTTGLPPAITGSSGEQADIVSANLEVGTGGRWLNTTALSTSIRRDLEPNAVRNFGARFQADVGIAPDGPETLANATTAGHQGTDTSVASDANGNYVVVWRGAGASGADLLLARVFNADGSARTGEITVAATTGFTRVAMADNGRFVVAWSSPNASGGNSAQAAVYQANGTLASGPITVASATSKDNYFVNSVAADADGDFVVLYTRASQSSFFTTRTLLAQRYTASGSASGKAITIVSPNLINGVKSVAMADAGNFVVAWDDTASNVHYVYAQRYDAAGRKAGSRITVASEPFTTPTGPGAVWQSSVAMNGSGQFVVAWHSRANGGKRAQFYSANGTPSGGTIAFASGGNAVEEPVAVALDDAGNATFAWTDSQGNYLSSTEVRLQQRTAAGVLAPVTIANTTTQGSQSQPGVAATGNGSFVVAWRGRGAGDDDGAYFRRYAPLAALSASGGAREGGAEALAEEALRPLVEEAVRRWEATGLSAEQVALLRNTNVHIADLGGALLGQASADAIWIDDDAAGWGWFIDPTPWDDSEHLTPGDQGEQGRMDLLSTLMHEMGHLLGHDHDDGGVMHEVLEAGSRLGVTEAHTPPLVGLPQALAPLDALVARWVAWENATLAHFLGQRERRG